MFISFQDSSELVDEILMLRYENMINDSDLQKMTFTSTINHQVFLGSRHEIIKMKCIKIKMEKEVRDSHVIGMVSTFPSSIP